MLYDLERDPDEQANLVGTADGAELEGALRDVLLRRLLREQFALRNDHLPGVGGSLRARLASTAFPADLAGPDR